MEINIPNRTSNGYYNVKKYIVVKKESGSRILQFGKISCQEKKIQVQLQAGEWERMKENYFSPDNVAANLGKPIDLSDKNQLQLEEWISPEQNKYHLVKFVQKDQGIGKYPSYLYSLTVSEYHNLMQLFPVIDITLGLCRLERIQLNLHSPSQTGGLFVQAPRKEEDWQQFRKDILQRSDEYRREKQ